MRLKGYRRIAKPSLELFIEIIIVFSLFERIFIQFGAPNTIIYFNDLLNVCLAIGVFLKGAWKKYFKFIYIYILIIFLAIFIAPMYYDQWGGNILTTIIEVRNIARFPVFFLACCTLLDQERMIKIFNEIIAFFFVNSLFIIYQYFFFHPPNTWMRGDLLNGLFGTTTGGNTYVNIILVITVSYLLIRWSNKKCDTKIFALSVLVSLIISALIELKAFFIEFIGLYLWYLIKSKKTKREIKINIIIIALAIIVSFVGLSIMYKEYPWFRETMTLKGIIGTLFGNGYTESGDVNRFTGMFDIGRKIFDGDILANLFGIGAGNCSSFNIAGSTSRFFDLYESTHYNWFSSTYTFVQSGWIGFALYVSTFIYLLKKRKANHELAVFSQIMCFIAIFLLFYGEGLKTDAGYFVYFAIASGFIKITKNNNKVSEKGKYFTEIFCKNL